MCIFKTWLLLVSEMLSVTDGRTDCELCTHVNILGVMKITVHWDMTPWNLVNIYTKDWR